jgi:hypothetical protein
MRLSSGQQGQHGSSTLGHGDASAAAVTSRGAAVPPCCRAAVVRKPLASAQQQKRQHHHQLQQQQHQMQDDAAFFSPAEQQPAWWCEPPQQQRQPTHSGGGALPPPAAQAAHQQLQGLQQQQPWQHMDHQDLPAAGSSMLPGPLTAAFIRLLKQHVNGGRTAQQQQEQEGLGTSFVQELVQHAHQLAPQLKPWQASLVLYVVVKLRLPHSPQLPADLLAQLQPHQLQLLPAPGLVNTLWAMAVLDMPPEEEWVAALYAAAEAGGRTGGDNNSTAAFAHLNQQQLVQLLWALGRLRQRPPPAWLQGLLAVLQPQLPTLSPTELANTLWGLAGIGYRPGVAWVDAWLAASRRSMSRACPDSLACQVACLGVLRVELRRNGAWLVALRGVLRLQLLPRMQPRHVAAIMCGLAKRRLQQPPHWVRLLLLRQLQLLDGRTGADLAARDVAATVWALPVLLHPTAADWAGQPKNVALLGQLAATSLPLLPCCSVVELVQLAVGFARLRFYPGAHWLKMHENAVARHRLPLTDANRWRLRAAARQLWHDG